MAKKVPHLSSRRFKRALDAFQQQGGLLRTSEAMRGGVHPATLYALRDAGTIELVSRGLYRLGKNPPLSNPDLVLVARRIPQGVVCLLSALQYHEITTQIPHEVCVALPPGAWKPRLAHPPIRVFHFTGNALTEGIETHTLDGVAVRIYDPEKTLADCFKFRNQIGMDTVMEALKLYRERRRLKVDALKGTPDQSRRFRSSAFAERGARQGPPLQRTPPALRHRAIPLSPFEGAARGSVCAQRGVAPSPTFVEYPTILDLPVPRLKGYSRESAIAEKFHAMTQLGILNSRMKDFFDIWLLARHFDFDGGKLSDAVRKTFEKRHIRTSKVNLSIPLYVRAPNGHGVATGEKSLKSTIAEWKHSSAALRTSMAEMFKTLKENGIG